MSASPCLYMTCASNCCNQLGYCPEDFQPNFYSSEYTQCYYYYDQPTTSNSQVNGVGSQMAIIIGASVGGFFFIIILTIVLVCACRRKNVTGQSVIQQSVHQQHSSHTNNYPNSYHTQHYENSANVLKRQQFMYHNQPAQHNFGYPYSANPVQNQPYFYPQQQGPIFIQ